MSQPSSRCLTGARVADGDAAPAGFGWSRSDTRRRQIAAGALMTPAERLDWLEEMLDEILPLVGRARQVERAREPRDNTPDAPS